MHLDSELKRVLKVVLPAFLAFPIVSPLSYWLSGKLDSWTDALLLSVGNLVMGCLLVLFYILGS